MKVVWLWDKGSAMPAAIGEALAARKDIWTISSKDLYLLGEPVLKGVFNPVDLLMHIESCDLVIMQSSYHYKDPLVLGMLSSGKYRFKTVVIDDYDKPDIDGLSMSMCLLYFKRAYDHWHRAHGVRSISYSVMDSYRKVIDSFIADRQVMFQPDKRHFNIGFYHSPPYIYLSPDRNRPRAKCYHELRRLYKSGAFGQHKDQSIIGYTTTGEEDGRAGVFQTQTDTPTRWGEYMKMLSNTKIIWHCESANGDIRLYEALASGAALVTNNMEIKLLSGLDESAKANVIHYDAENETSIGLALKKALELLDNPDKLGQAMEHTHRLGQQIQNNHCLEYIIRIFNEKKKSFRQ